MADIKKWSTEEISNWNAFQEWASKFGDKTLFRGQPEEYGNLQPTFLRLLEKEKNYEKALKIEKEVVEDFRRDAPVYFQEQHLHRLTLGNYEGTFLQWCALMQHYGAPTRLLDWTGSPYVAAYFAVCEKEEKNSEIWWYEQEELENTWGDDKGAWNYWNTYQWNTETKDEIQWKIRHFCLDINPIRVSSQQAVFTICRDVYLDHADELAEKVPDDKRGRIVIPNGQKIVFLRELKKMNITGASLFPSLEGIGFKARENAILRLSDH